jgi:diadenosine tetraphosphate (Ap4A) HIT family hydrolase
VYEFLTSPARFGKPPYYRGYVPSLYKQHVRELHEHDKPEYLQQSQELISASQAMPKPSQPWKLNHACLGNQDQHIHWHIIPVMRLILITPNILGCTALKHKPSGFS